MTVKFQYNKTSLQALDKQLKVRERALPTIKSKESALRMEVTRNKDEINALNIQLATELQRYEKMISLWSDFDPNLVSVKDVGLVKMKIAGVAVPVLKQLEFEVKQYSLFNSPQWTTDGIELLKGLTQIGIRIEFAKMKLEILEYARKKTTQKVNLFEKVQIPGYKDAIIKIKRYLEDEQSLSKASQKIMRNNLEKRRIKEEEA
ncbi:MAG: V-type ATP synthase subunit D [Tannerella sp.]|jgi:V/A-type H+-transporting ATPase subunit D|nr:V-type ATP synthase subunit D [Tannerella sp.]